MPFYAAGSSLEGHWYRNYSKLRVFCGIQRFCTTFTSVVTQVNLVYLFFALEVQDGVEE